VDAAVLRVLLVGESQVGFSSLSQRLENNTCQCQFVSSGFDGARLLAQCTFDLVLCSSQIDGFQALCSAACSSSASLFRYVLEEDGCWWIPAVLRGEECAGTPALRPSEFAKTLDTMLKEAKLSAANVRLITARCGRK
jgi:hypothetical protein